MTNTVKTISKYNHEHDCPFEAFITNLGKYNEGYLVGEWVKFPCTNEELENVFKRIGINEYYEEFFITDYDCYVDNLYNHLGEYESIETLNELSQMIEDLDIYDFERFQAVLEIECVNSLEDIKELIENIDNYNLYADITNSYDLGYYYAIELDCLNIPSHLENYIDFDSYGRDLSFEIDGDFTDFGWLERC